ncbi:hypothetical protein A2U01_0039283 [Trifolium medium]|uniref:Uncharacterized protein n=1 Tax=Trifolium medium TaxID=97028 RepID=A0A392Q1D3_9FABA|nr:hypothetical protein [Trifolium medium]MCI18131.1 hypothetical protein [Trifolium medium]
MFESVCVYDFSKGYASVGGIVSASREKCDESDVVGFNFSFSHVNEFGSCFE